MVDYPNTDPLDVQSAPAALAASTYAPTVNGAVVSGWFLPSIEELDQIFLSSVGGLAPGAYYSSSSQRDKDWISVQRAARGGADGNWRASGTLPAPFKVRAVRAF